MTPRWIQTRTDFLKVNENLQSPKYTSVANKALNPDRHPVHFGIIVFPGFQALDVFGPLDAFNTLSFAFDVPLKLSIIAETLDTVSTRPRTAVPGASDFDESIVPTHTYDTAPPLDVLIVPGGQGTRDPTSVQRAIDFVGKVYESLQYLITVCTGAGIAARAGVLDGRRATTNKKAWESIVALRDEVYWVAHARWVVDGKNWTSSGVSAGMDVTFAFIGHVWGDQTALDLANALEYERHTDPSWDPFAGLYNLKDHFPPHFVS
ncbi:hypothetical protein H0H81_007390 [Sphagnurus paluster]|uniref:DJ-1/PfpI domain-containing protein n=1 Tax=Sphagnurus paluster TaxID=117069 RepID=A0A9P7FWZ2_9AGAR|nr:hypothetical protein H0H81_007390 [Sphagnurus paluster]